MHESVDGLVEEVLDARAHAGEQVGRAAERRQRAGDREDLRGGGQGAGGSGEREEAQMKGSLYTYIR